VLEIANASNFFFICCSLKLCLDNPFKSDSENLKAIMAGSNVKNKAIKYNKFGIFDHLFNKCLMLLYFYMRRINTTNYTTYGGILRSQIQYPRSIFLIITEMLLCCGSLGCIESLIDIQVQRALPQWRYQFSIQAR